MNIVSVDQSGYLLGIFRVFGLLDSRGIELYDVNLFGEELKGVNSGQVLKKFNRKTKYMEMREDLRDCSVFRSDRVEIYTGKIHPKGKPDIVIREYKETGKK